MTAPAGDGFDAAHGLAALLDGDHPVKTEMADWARTVLASDDLAERERTNAFWRDGWKRCAERGLPGAVVPKEYGGQGHDLVTAMLMFEGLGLGCADNGLAFALSCQTWAMQTALLAGTDDAQKQRLLPGLCNGEVLGGFAMTELESGSDPYSLSTIATPADGGYRMSGHKAFVTMGPLLDFVIVFATVNPELGRWGITAFIVDTDLEGVTLEPNRDKMGTRTTPFCDIAFDDVFIAEENRMGAEGAGGAIFNAAVEAERAFLFAAQLGLMERQIDTAVRYAREREQFGQPIGNFQAVSHRIADMKYRHETARLLLYKTALQHDTGQVATMTATLTKLAITEGAVASAADAVLLHGARGYITEFGVERDLRDVMGSVVYSGTSDIQRNIIARLLGVG